VSAEHDHHRALFFRGCHDGVDHGAEVARDQNVGQRFQESGEAPVIARRRGKFRGRDFVGAPLDRNRADFG
jgi:hypothetical protein